MENYQTGVRPIIDAEILKQSKEVRDYGEYWSASSAGHCHKLLILRRLKVPKSPEMAEREAITQRVFSVGHIFHNWVQDLTKQSGNSLAQEGELISEKLLVKGHFDDLIQTKKDDIDHLFVVDYKTVHSGYFDYGKNEINYFRRLQLGTYIYILRNELPTKYPPQFSQIFEGRILNISKDDLRLSENILAYDEQVEADVLDYWQGLNKAWETYQKTKILPKCTCADPEKAGGFMGRRSKKGKIFNDYFYRETPCSDEWINRAIKETLAKEDKK